MQSRLRKKIKPKLKPSGGNIINGLHVGKFLMVDLLWTAIPLIMISLVCGVQRIGAVVHCGAQVLLSQLVIVDQIIKILHF